MFLRVSLVFLLVFSLSNAHAQIMHIHMGEEDREFNLAEVDSITYTDLVISLSVEPETIEFEPVIVDRVQNAILTVHNTGNGVLIINSVDLEEGVFSILFDEPLFIAPEQSFEFTVSFFPQEVGDFSSEILITSNSQTEPEVTIPVSGSGYIPDGQVHFIYEPTDVSMSILVLGALIGEESLVENDEVGVFTTDELCAGAAIIPDGFPDRQAGIPAFGAVNGMDNGFQNGEQLTFRIWDIDAETEYATNFEIENNIEPIWEANGFIVLRLNAIVE